MYLINNNNNNSQINLILINNNLLNNKSFLTMHQTSVDPQQVPIFQTTIPTLEWTPNLHKC